jgi:thioredoxin 1
MELFTRLGIAGLIVSAGIALYFASTRLRLLLLSRRTKRTSDLGFELRAGVPAILYFTTPDCAPCRTVQGPAIEQLRAQFGDRLQIVKVDASDRTDLANYWGVLSVPTTFIIDAQGRPRHVNNGVTLAPRLRQQLREFGGLIDATAEKPRASIPKKSEAYRTR